MKNKALRKIISLLLIAGLMLSSTQTAYAAETVAGSVNREGTASGIDNVDESESSDISNEENSSGESAGDSVDENSESESDEISSDDVESTGETADENEESTSESMEEGTEENITESGTGDEEALLGDSTEEIKEEAEGELVVLNGDPVSEENYKGIIEVKIGSKKTLYEGDNIPDGLIKAGEAKSATVTLKDNIEVLKADKSLTFTGNVTLISGEYSISTSVERSGSGPALIEVDGTLNISGSASIIGCGGFSVIGVYGKVILTGKSDKVAYIDGNGANSVIYVDEGGDFIMKGGSIINSSGQGIYADLSSYINISRGVIDAPIGIKTIDEVDIYFSGGEINAEETGIYLDGSSNLNLSGGSINVYGPDKAYGTDTKEKIYGINNAGSGEIRISGGEISARRENEIKADDLSTFHSDIYGIYNGTNGYGKVIMTGGSVSVAIPNYADAIYSGYALMNKNGELPEITGGSIEAVDGYEGTTNYSEDKRVVYGIYIQSDATETETMSLSNLSIDAGNYGIYSNAKINGLLNNCGITADKTAFFDENTESSYTLDGCYIKNDGDKYAIYTNASLTLKNITTEVNEEDNLAVFALYSCGNGYITVEDSELRGYGIAMKDSSGSGSLIVKDSKITTYVSSAVCVNSMDTRSVNIYNSDLTSNGLIALSVKDSATVNVEGSRLKVATTASYETASAIYVQKGDSSSSGTLVIKGSELEGKNGLYLAEGYGDVTIEDSTLKGTAYGVKTEDDYECEIAIKNSTLEVKNTDGSDSSSTAIYAADTEASVNIDNSCINVEANTEVYGINTAGDVNIKGSEINVKTGRDTNICGIQKSAGGKEFNIEGSKIEAKNTCETGSYRTHAIFTYEAPTLKDCSLSVSAYKANGITYSNVDTAESYKIYMENTDIDVSGNGYAYGIESITPSTGTDSETSFIKDSNIRAKANSTDGYAKSIKVFGSDKATTTFNISGCTFEAEGGSGTNSSGYYLSMACWFKSLTTNISDTVFASNGEQYRTAEGNLDRSNLQSGVKFVATGDDPIILLEKSGDDLGSIGIDFFDENEDPVFEDYDTYKTLVVAGYDLASMTELKGDGEELLSRLGHIRIETNSSSDSIDGAVWYLDGNIVKEASSGQQGLVLLSLNDYDCGPHNITWKGNIKHGGQTITTTLSKDIVINPKVTFASCKYNGSSEGLGICVGVDSDIVYSNNYHTITLTTAYGETLTASEVPEAPVLEGYVFSHWAKVGDSNGKKVATKVDLTEISVTEDITSATEVIYAVMVPESLWVNSTDYSVSKDSSGAYILSTTGDGFAYKGGKAIVPEFTVYYGTHELGSSDYKLTCKNNKNVGTATATLIGKGNYSGKIVLKYDITPCDFTDSNVEYYINGVCNTNSDTIGCYSYTGKEITPDIKLVDKNSGKALKKGKDYTVKVVKRLEMDYDPAETTFKEAGQYGVYCYGKGNYAEDQYNSIVFNMKIVDAVHVNKLNVSKIAKQPYTGSTIVPEITVKYGKKTLTAGTDYTIVTDGFTNKEVGTGYIAIQGNGTDYIGYRKISFKITGTPLSSKAVKFGWYGSVKNKSVEDDPATFWLLHDKTYLKNGTDYTYTIEVRSGYRIYTITGIGGYTGKLTKKYKVKLINIKDAYSLRATGMDNKLDIVINGGEPVYYDKNGVKPEVKINGESATNYGKISYTANKKAGTGYVVIKASGIYTGTLKLPFAILQKSLNNDDITVSLSDRKSSKKAGDYKTAIKLYDNGKALKQGTDYTGIVYKDSKGNELTNKSKINAGDVITVSVTGKGSYMGTCTDTFRVEKTLLSSVNIKANAKTYTGYEVTLNDGDLTFNKGKSDLVSGVDYVIVSYSKNVNAGTATATIKGIGNYAGVKKVQFKISKTLFRLLIDVFS